MCPTHTADVWDPKWLRERGNEILEFYYPACLNDDGYRHRFRADGTAEPSVEPLVGTCRFIYGFAEGVHLDGPAWCVHAARHGIDRLRTAFADDVHGGFYWELAEDGSIDETKYAYGHAFALLALSQASSADVAAVDAEIAAVYDLLDDRLFEPEYGLYAVEATREWEPITYRGQNANMHLCEACLAAYEATGDERYLERASTIATAVVRCLSTGEGNIWEHFDEEWTADWTYNADDPDNLFRPHGYLPGHFVEWAKLLCLLDQHEPTDWRIPAAVRLFESAVDVAWDERHGGLQYAFDRDGRITNDRKYYWVTAEQLAAAATLMAAGEPFEAWYERTWAYALDTHVAADAPVWHRVLARDGSTVPESTPLSPPNKTDYHVLSALKTCRDAVL
ncbi:AGE family epimerase/isomerase [Halosolutus halophilus]|uniref:AGE family epimerase/isomerase n=1 Tax=Halosolutus halophilus TaxID=1552990 RepID=UPI0022350999|nr:AGE family epimerase/isomerase [Halosolutus halophilus]